MDDFLWDTQAMERLLLDAFKQNELGDDVDVVDTFFLSLESASTTHLFGRVQGSQLTHIGTTMFLYNLKPMYGMSNACFSTLLR
jgi:hypothetical protein